MITGKNIASFLQKHLGGNFEQMYDKSIQQAREDEAMEEDVKKEFKIMFEKINK